MVNEKVIDKESEDRLKKLFDNHICPHCGRCPTCGRRLDEPTPIYPVYPQPYYQIVWRC